MNAAQEWPSILQFGAGDTISEELVEQRYKRLAHKYHPDAGGNNEDMTQLNLAKKLALAWIEKERRKQVDAATAQRDAVFAAAQRSAKQQQDISAAFWNQMAGQAQAQSYWQQTMGAQAYANASGWASSVADESAKPKEEPAPPKLSRWQKAIALVKRLW
jgi:hypothetical protein